MSRSDDQRSASEQARDVAAMFDKVAPRYDFLNRVLSGRRDIGWRRRTVAVARLGPGEGALDVGVGTGDLSFDVLVGSDRSSRVVGIDVSEEMLRRARSRAAGRGLGAQFEARAADVHALPFADAS